MPAFLVAILQNLLVAAALALLSGLLYRNKTTEPPKPSTDEYKPTAKEGTEVLHLFGTGPVELLVVGVFNRETTAIQR